MTTETKLSEARQRVRQLARTEGDSPKKREAAKVLAAALREQPKLSDRRELVLQRPVEKGSRGRNGVFTATSVEVFAYRGGLSEPPFLSVEGRSRRVAREAPAQLCMSLEDAVVLAEEILAAVRAVTEPVPASLQEAASA